MHETRPSGSLAVARVPRPPLRHPINTIEDALKYGTPQGKRLSWRADRSLLEYQEANAENFERSLRAQAAAQDAARGGAVAIVGHLWLAKNDRLGHQQDLGLVSCRVVTTAGVNYIVDSFQGTTEPENMKFHGVGTGSGAEAVGNTALVTELTTQYAVASTRPTGSLGELSGNANVFETIATITVSATVALIEHGLFSQAAVAGGTLLDRSVFSTVNLLSGESLAATYDLSFVSGG